MPRTKTLEHGLTAVARRSWREAYAQLAAADREAPLEAADLERLATAAYLLGRDAECADLLARAHHDHLSRNDVEAAARAAFWLAFVLLSRGEHARASGWLARAQRVLEQGGIADCAVQGYLLIPAAIRAVTAGATEDAYRMFCEADEISARCGDADLTALARHGRGRALIRMGNVAEGLALLDETMVAVTAGELSPLVAGDVYCSVIEACHEIFDLRRAHEWTMALSDWCASQPDIVVYRGQCLVRRAELMQLRGAWPQAMEEARRACERLAEPPGQAAIGAAFYQRGELHRLRGDFAEAAEAYRQASASRRNPQPGLALLRLAQGQVDTAAAAIRTALDEAQAPRVRSRLLPAYVEIMLAARDIPAARAGAEELVGLAVALDAPFLRATAAHAAGSVMLADRDARGALAKLREAVALWDEVEAPYETARTRALLASACRRLGDIDGASLELNAAVRVFESLGAAHDLARLEPLLDTSGRAPAGGLSARELDVLRLLATGRTNRMIAEELDISEKTVARHVSNIFNKLNLSSRSAATAYAYEHRLV